MEYTTLGETGLRVSRICLGCMSFGADWGLDRGESEAVIDRAIDLGINFFDTANVYGRGTSEEILGRGVAEYDRDHLVIATKVYGDMDPEIPNARGLSRKAIEQELAASLDRLDMETIDLYQTHRWDYDTPISETLRTLDDAVRRGQVRYLGTSSMWAFQFADALSTSDGLGLERFVSMQNHYNPVYREEEREMLPLCHREGIGVLPWSPLAQGYLTRPHEELEATERGTLLADRKHVYRSGGGPEINARIQQIAADVDATMAQVVLAWHLSKEVVTAPIIGISRMEHLEEAVEALDLSLSERDIAFIEEPYQAVAISGHE